MLDSESPLLVTGANGQLGRLVIEQLLQMMPAGRIVAMVRSAEAASRYAPLNLRVAIADYDQPATLDAAFAGVGRVLLVSSNDLSQRVTQHRNVIAAAARAGAGVAYTSLLRADISPLGLAADHRDTEAALRESGLPYVVLRNGWYSENYTAMIPAALAHHAFFGSAGAGRIASAARADYAAAAASVLAAPEPWTSQVLELAGDQSYTLSEFAAEVTRQCGQQIPYQNLTQTAYAAALRGAGLPPEVAALLADSDTGAARGALFDEARTLSQVIGRATTPIAATIAQALGG